VQTVGVKGTGTNSQIFIPIFTDLGLSEDIILEEDPWTRKAKTSSSTKINVNLRAPMPKIFFSGMKK
jgi:hypothetical protein